ncbi:hypothetical protein DBV05_g5692 [Lasiodiplodia theobromae]|uniref:Uncharacterized protein n=1 Tax=Lasiodiplodia theobromae TaxID=45133 RepID=A0A5N5DES2_9PEZI|nr:hypothetical protein DBV05_g5692 [Lasiodiplodia theobromae]
MDQDTVQARLDEVLAADAIEIRRAFRNFLMYAFDVVTHSCADPPPQLADEEMDDDFEYIMLKWYHAGDLPHRRIQQRREARELLAQEDPAYAALLQEAISTLHISDTDDSSVASTTHENEPESDSQKIGDGQPQDHPTTDANAVGPVAEESANPRPLYPRNSNTSLRILSVGGRELTHLGPTYIAVTNQGLKRFSEETIKEHSASHLLQNHLRGLSSQANLGVGQPSNTPRHPSVGFPSESPFENNGRTGFGPSVGNPLNSQHIMDVDLSVKPSNKPADENPDAESDKLTNENPDTESDKPADENSDAESDASVTGIKPNPDAGPSNQGPGSVIEIKSDHSSMDDWPAAPEDDYLSESSVTTDDTAMARPVPLSTMVWADSMFPFLQRIQVTGVQLAPIIQTLPLLSQYRLKPLEAFASIFEHMHIMVGSLSLLRLTPYDS